MSESESENTARQSIDDEPSDDHNVRIDEFTKVYRSGGEDVVAVENLNIDIRRGEFLVFVGPSGCGKTTTLRTVAGLEEATEGRIWIEGNDVTGKDPRERGIAMVFQNYALYPHMTVRENMSFPLRIRNYPDDEVDSRVEEAAALLSIDDLLERKPSELSGGQQQRVALGRAIVREPSVFLMDEPLSNLDARLRLEMRAELRRLHAEHRITTVYVTHDQEEAMALSDRLAVLHAGRIQQCGAPLKIYNDPANLFVAGFVGSPPMNVFDGALLDQLLKFPQQAKTGGILAAIRPVDTSLATANGDSIFAGEVILCEPTGADLWVMVRWRDQRIMARGHVDRPFAPGAKVYLDFPRERVYLFDRASGARLR